MLSDFNIFRLEDKNKKNDIELHVNWRPKDEETNGCKVIKFVLPDKKEAYITKENLLTILFLMGSPREQTKMLPVTVTKVRHLRKDMYVMIPTDMRKGEILKVPVTMSIPSVADEVIGEISKDILAGRVKPTKESLEGKIDKVPKKLKEVAIEHKVLKPEDLKK